MALWSLGTIRPLRWVGDKIRRMGGIGSDRSGQVAIIVAFSIIPLIGAVGIATDTARGYLVKSRLQAAVDSAGLAGGRVFYDSNRDADIQQYFASNFPAGYMNSTIKPLKITSDTNNETITLNAQATIPTTFMRLLGSKSITVAASAQIARKTDRLHVVLALDMSSSMLDDISGHSTTYTNSRLYAAKSAAHTLINNLFGTNTTNNLLKIGIVPWAGKVNVTTNGTRYGYDSDGAGGWVPHSGQLYTTESVNYTNPYPSISGKYPYETHSSSTGFQWKYASPFAGMARTQVYYAHNAPSVPLFDPPPTGWKGCVYARFAGDDSTSADTLLGRVTVNGAYWGAWEPTGMPRETNITLSAPYAVNSGDGLITGGTFGVAQGSASSGQSVAVKTNGTFPLPKATSSVCSSYYWWGGCRSWSSPAWSQGDVIYWDSSNRRATTSSSSNTRIGVAAADAASGDSTGQVTLDENATGDTRGGGNNNSDQYPNSVCLDTHAYANSSSSYYRTSDCTPCPENGITPLDSTKSDVSDAIDSLAIPSSSMGFSTNIPQGLQWAWEVLMPGTPFDEGNIPNVPASEVPRAIVLLTDGQDSCWYGDGYQNYPNPDDYCGGTGPGTWRDNRVRTLAQNIKAQGVYLYMIQFAECNGTTADLLKEVATKPDAPYYYCAPTAAELQDAFTEISNNLSNLRLSR